MMHSVKITRKSSLGSLSDEFIQMQHLSHSSSPSLSQSTPLPLLYNYSDYNPDIQNRSCSLSLTSDHSLFSQISDYNLSKKVVSNMRDFLERLNKEFGNGKFTRSEER